MFYFCLSSPELSKCFLMGLKVAEVFCLPSGFPVVFGGRFYFTATLVRIRHPLAAHLGNT